MIKFAYTILYVQEVKKSILFYTNTFGFKEKFITPDGSYGEIESGSTTLSFAQQSLAQTNLKDKFIASHLDNAPLGFEIAFTTNQVEHTLKVAEENGAQIIEYAKLKPWGQTVAYVRDPDGFLVEICTPVN